MTTPTPEPALELDLLDDDDMPPEHPLAHLLDVGGWNRPGRCICGAPMPPQAQWHANSEWIHFLCPTCGRQYVDEEQYVAIYDPEDQTWDPEDEACDLCLPLRQAGPPDPVPPATEPPPGAPVG